MAKVSREFGIAEQTLRNWVRQADGDQTRARPAARTQPNAESRHTYVVEAAAAPIQRFEVQATDLRTAMTRAEARLEDPNRIISITRV